MKKIVSLILVAVMSFFAIEVIAFAEDIEELPASRIETSFVEEKIICNADINDDFEPDSIVVALNIQKAKSLKHIQ